MQLMLLGRTEAAATPWIVFTCRENAQKKVERFLQKKSNQNIYHGPRFCRYRFDTAVLGRPLALTASKSPDEVFFYQEDLSLFEDWTPRIKVGQLGTERYATVGGFVSIIDSRRKKSLYGLTVGHVLPADDSYTDDGDVLSDSDTEDELGDDDNNDVDGKNTALLVASENAIEAGMSIGTDDGGLENVAASSLNDEHILALQESSDADTQLSDPQSKIIWASFGKMSKASYSHRARNRDWALIELNSIEIGQIKGFSKDCPNELRKAASATGDRSAIRDRSAVIGDRSRRQCTISTLPASAVLPSGFDFVDVHVLQVPNGELPETGSSGSWIIASDQTNSSEVYGTLIATDVFGFLWMVPMVDILKDIQEEFGAVEGHQHHTTDKPASAYYEIIAKRKPVIIWYCSGCGNGPFANWNIVCTECAHPRCSFCVSEEA
ncbi:hypothetical protein HBI24_089970 [Parastagonospora nodorum]|nr:hypothetical protein HBI09_075020 [Parastagonospora nodorum]KAH5015766.1 hypothetical protein HBI77_062820 [Parastagonospora nodorum]KAH5205141.1 hypothetical protein HBH77_101340 [Parastagonospora nodorum]KAH5584498.1 hypothetical protein HBI24_089970 [Parastagonospora nodorum]KAH5772629.1 hypothetical protein HBI16_114910 [Parastagonospora nodorum]